MLVTKIDSNEATALTLLLNVDHFEVNECNKIAFGCCRLNLSDFHRVCDAIIDTNDLKESTLSCSQSSIHIDDLIAVNNIDKQVNDSAAAMTSSDELQTSQFSESEMDRLFEYIQTSGTSSNVTKLDDCTNLSSNVMAEPDNGSSSVNRKMSNCPMLNKLPCDRQNDDNLVESRDSTLVSDALNEQPCLGNSSGEKISAYHVAVVSVKEKKIEIVNRLPSLETRIETVYTGSVSDHCIMDSPAMVVYQPSDYGCQSANDTSSLEGDNGGIPADWTASERSNESLFFENLDGNYILKPRTLTTESGVMTTVRTAAETVLDLYIGDHDFGGKFDDFSIDEHVLGMTANDTIGLNNSSESEICALLNSLANVDQPHPVITGLLGTFNNINVGMDVVVTSDSVGCSNGSSSAKIVDRKGLSQASTDVLRPVGENTAQTIECDQSGGMNDLTGTGTVEGCSGGKHAVEFYHECSRSPDLFGSPSPSINEESQTFMPVMSSSILQISDGMSVRHASRRGRDGKLRSTPSTGRSPLTMSPDSRSPLHSSPSPYRDVFGKIPGLLEKSVGHRGKGHRSPATLSQDRYCGNQEFGGKFIGNESPMSPPEMPSTFSIERRSYKTPHHYPVAAITTQEGECRHMSLAGKRRYSAASKSPRSKHLSGGSSTDMNSLIGDRSPIFSRSSTCRTGEKKPYHTRYGNDSDEDRLPDLDQPTGNVIELGSDDEQCPMTNRSTNKGSSSERSTGPSTPGSHDLRRVKKPKSCPCCQDVKRDSSYSSGSELHVERSYKNCDTCAAAGHHATRYDQHHMIKKTSKIQTNASQGSTPFSDIADSPKVYAELQTYRLERSTPVENNDEFLSPADKSLELINNLEDDFSDEFNDVWDGFDNDDMAIMDFPDDFESTPSTTTTEVFILLYIGVHKLINFASEKFRVF